LPENNFRKSIAQVTLPIVEVSWFYMNFNLPIDIWGNFKKYTGLALLFLCLGAGGMAVGGKSLLEVFQLDLVPRNFYIYKSDIDKTHVPIERFKEVAADLKLTKKQSESFKKQLLKSSASTSRRQRLEQQEDAIIAEQQRTDESIDLALRYQSLSNEEPSIADTARVQELRRRSELWNQQLTQVRTELSKCVQ
jgi:hypothetical protein